MFQLPDNWRSLSDGELSALLVEGVGAASAAMSDGDGERLASIQLAVDTVKAELDERKRTAALKAELAESMTQVVKDAVTEGLKEIVGALSDEDLGDTAVAEPEVDEAPATEVDDETIAEIDAAAEGDEPVDSDEEPGEDTQETEVVDGDAEPPAELSDGAKLPAQPKKGGRQLMLARSWDGRDAGTPISEIELAEMMHDVARDLPLESGRVKLASLSYEADHQWLTGDYENDLSVLRDVMGGGQASLESLVASGGWGTPSQIDYGFFELEGPVETLDVPTVNVNRGGLKYLTGGGPTINDILGTAALWSWSEANDISATGGSPTKTNLKLPVPAGFTDTRLGAKGIWLKNGNLIERSWPEHTRRWMRLGVLGHGHYINNWAVTTIQAACTARTWGGAISGDGYTATLLEAVEYFANFLRDKYRMPRGATFEAVFPSWAYSAVRADLSRRTGVDMLNVTDGMIAGWFAARGIRTQFPHDYQMLTDVDGPYPATVKFMLWPSGTFAKGVGGSFTLGVFRSETDISTNDHTAMFTEDFVSMMMFGPEALEVTVTGTHTGQTGLQA